VTLEADEGWSLLESLAATGIAGGRAYDALIAACARATAAEHILTLNARDFATVAPDLNLIVP
jgi:predicted nucleic acid-binding protein